MSHGDKNYPGNLPFTKDEIKTMNGKSSNEVVFNISKNIAYQQHFNVGEVLIAVERKDHSKAYKDNNGQPQKFVVKHKDENGLIYCKTINSSGKLSTSIELIADWDYNNYMFIQDPEVVEHVLLGDERDYDPFATAKKYAKLRGQIQRHNRKLRILFKTPEEAKAWMRSLAVGTRIFKKSGRSVDEFEFTGISTPPAAQPTSAFGYRSQQTPQELEGSFKVIKSDSTWTMNQKNYTIRANQFSQKYYEYYHTHPRVFEREVKDGE